MKMYRVLVTITTGILILGVWILIFVSLAKRPNPFESLSREQVSQLRNELDRSKSYNTPDPDLFSMSDKELRLWLFPVHYKPLKSKINTKELVDEARKDKLLPEGPIEDEEMGVFSELVHHAENGMFFNERAQELIKEARKRGLIKPKREYWKGPLNEDIIAFLADYLPKERRQEFIREMFERERREKSYRANMVKAGTALSLVIVVIGVVLLFPAPAYYRVFKRKPRKHTLIIMIVLVGTFNSLALLDLSITKRELTTLIVFNLTVLIIGGLFLYLLNNENQT